ncbi:MAG: hypothetical protein ACYSTJ_10035, partial [Planctomycetota bacterium]
MTRKGHQSLFLRCAAAGELRFWAKNEGKTVDYECDGIGNRRFWAKKRGPEVETCTNVQLW